jgi:hypothetical protein
MRTKKIDKIDKLLDDADSCTIADYAIMLRQNFAGWVFAGWFWIVVDKRKRKEFSSVNMTGGIFQSRGECKTHLLELLNVIMPSSEPEPTYRGSVIHLFREHDLEAMLQFAASHLTDTERENFNAHARGKSTQPLGPAPGWILYWGFSDFLANCLTFPDDADPEYNRGRQLAIKYLEQTGSTDLPLLPRDEFERSGKPVFIWSKPS